MKGLYDTSLPNNWSKKLYEEHYFDIAPEHFDKIASVLFEATAQILSNSKSKDKPVAMVFRKINNELLGAAICEYFANEEDTSKPGNYSLVWTFYEDDIPANAVIVDLNNAATHSFFRAVAGSKWNFEFDTVGDMIILLGSILEDTKKWLDENAKEGAEVGVEVEGIYQAMVSIENGEKIFAIVPDGLIKVLIKDDASIEK